MILIPALLAMGLAGICRCAADDCSHGADQPSTELTHSHHHEHSHQHESPGEPADEDPVPHNCDHSAEPMVQVCSSIAIPIIPLVMIWLDYLRVYPLKECVTEGVCIDAEPPLARSVLIEPYRPLLI